MEYTPSIEAIKIIRELKVVEVFSVFMALLLLASASFKPTGYFLYYMAGTLAGISFTYILINRKLLLKCVLFIDKTNISQKSKTDDKKAKINDKKDNN